MGTELKNKGISVSEENVENNKKRLNRLQTYHMRLKNIKRKEK